MDRLFRFFAITECRVHDVNSFQEHSQATVSCSQPEYSDLLMSCQMVGWVCIGVVVSSDPSPLTSLTVSEQGFGLLVSGGGQGLQLLLPDLARRSALSFPGVPVTVGHLSITSKKKNKNKNKPTTTKPVSK